ncbi:hypothetical protein ANO14919_142240 [Xylariales sp. No.14919]|nr:hypothetical protein F5X98DRAFT_369356 [Xylaria grammica]GAW24633.1 hypothetical protein ANO14919_142240 [Xylariales sp. No.14919]
MAAQQQRRQPGPKIDLSTLQSAEIARARPGPRSPQLEKDAKRAMAHTADWQPSLAGGHAGYRQEDRRREIMVSSGASASALAGGGTAGPQEMGFSEGPGA